MDALTPTHTVALRGYPGLPKLERTADQLRFASSLDYQSPGRLKLHTRCARCVRFDVAPEDASMRDIEALHRWVRAATTVARSAGFHGLPHDPASASKCCWREEDRGQELVAHSNRARQVKHNCLRSSNGS